MEQKWSIGARMEHLQPVKIARIGYMENATKMAETLVNTGFPPLFIPERAGIRTPDNLIKSQVLWMPFIV